MKFELVAKAATVLGAAAVATLLAAAPSAVAEPAQPPAPQPLPAENPATVLAPQPLLVEGPAPLLAQQPPPAEGPATALAAPAPATEGIPHLASPENLPPDTSAAPPTDTSRLGYLRDLWHAMQTQEVSGSDALLLLTQRPLSSTPPAGTP